MEAGAETSGRSCGTVPPAAVPATRRSSTRSRGRDSSRSLPPPLPVELELVDRSAFFQERRRRARRRRQIRRLSVAGVLVTLAAGVGFVTQATGGDDAPEQRQAKDRPPVAKKAAPALPTRMPVPLEMRGVHVTLALASDDDKLDEYLRLRGLNTLQVDVKDENGEVGFVPSSVPLAREIGAARPYYKPRVLATEVHAQGVYLVGRIVCFEDPILSAKRPDLAVQRPDGSRWLNHAGLGWTNPYDRRVWEYNVDIAAAAARAGFDEIQFDYVRFPSDGDIEQIRYPRKTETPFRWVIPEFVHYASKRLKPLGVRVSADVFGLSATRDLGIGQVPRRMARYLDAIYPMVYPSHYGSGEYNLDDPNAEPGRTVAASLRDFRRQLRGRKTRIIPWLQDFSYGRTYTLADVQQQIDAARRARSGGFLLWNAARQYTDGPRTYDPPG